MALVKNNNGEADTVTLLEPKKNQRIVAGIDEANMAHIISRLTELYSNPVEATVREITSNAFDAGSNMSDPAPIELTSPTSVSPYFICRDYGVGMSLAEVTNRYANYGASNKGNDLDSIGQFGLGGKAPLAYTSYFNVVTVKDGIATEFTMERYNGETTTEIKSSEPSTEPSGTTVTVPVEFDDIERFHRAIERYKNFSYNSPIRIDGTEYSGNSNHKFMGEIDIHHDGENTVKGEVYFDQKYTTRAVKNFNNLSKSNIEYVLHGWNYQAETNSLPAMYYVKIVPGIVNFGTSRDEIINDARLSELNELVVSQLSTNEMFRKTIQSLRNLSKEEVIEFAKELSANYSEFDGTYTFKDYYNSYGSGEVSDLDTPHGFNAGFLMGLENTGPFSFLLSELPNRGNTFISLKLGHRDFTSFTYASTNDFKTLKDFKEFSLTAAVFRKGEQFVEQNKEKLVVLYGVKDEFMSKFVRHRQAAFYKSREKTLYAISIHGKDRIEADVEFAQLLTNEKYDVVYMSSEEYLASIKDDLKELRLEAAEIRKSEDDALLTTNILFKKVVSTGVSNAEFVAEASLEREYNNFNEILADPNSLIIFSSTWSLVYIGLANSGKNPLGKNIYVTEHNLNAAEARKLLPKKSQLAFSTNYNDRSKAVQELVANNSFSGYTFDEELKKISFEALINRLVSKPYRSNLITLKDLFESIPKTDENAQLISVAQATIENEYSSVSQEQASDELVKRYGDSILDSIAKLNKFYNAGETVQNSSLEAVTLRYTFFIQDVKDKVMKEPLYPIVKESALRIILD